MTVICECLIETAEGWERITLHSAVPVVGSE